MSEPLPRIRVIDLETAGNGPHDVCEIGWQDVEQGDDGLWRLSDARGSRLVNPGRPISPETMAVHHILDEQVSGAPFWKTVAPEILRPEGGVLALAAHRAAFEQRYCRPHLTGGAGWICTWKGALRLWPAAAELLEPEAALSAPTGGPGARDGPAGASRAAGRLCHRPPSARHAE